MLTIPAGEFVRGSNQGRWDEKPEQVVFLDGFEIDRYEVTNLQYRRFVQETGTPAPKYWDGVDYPDGQGRYPVVGVTWAEAGAYCQWAGERLPSEAEWEKACRGSKGSIYPWGDEWEARLGNTDPLAGSFLPALGADKGASPFGGVWDLLREPPALEPDGRGLMPVGSYPQGASPYGVLDLVGNASEWVEDWYAFADYSKLPLRNPHTPGPHWNHAIRGSAWFDPNGGPAWVIDQSRCSARNSSHVPRDARVGFRCARSL